MVYRSECHLSCFVGVGIVMNSVQLVKDFHGFTEMFLFSSGRKISESSGTHNIVFIYDDGKYDLVSSPVSVICIGVEKKTSLISRESYCYDDNSLLFLWAVYFY
jgi:hypothetical protein